MLSYLQAEWLKQKHSFNKTLIWLAPLVTILLALVMMGGSFLHQGAYNWWYISFLPACFTMVTAFTTARERRRNRHGLLSVVIDKKRLWRAQIIICTLFLLTTCLLFFVGLTLGGILIGHTLSVTASFLASMLLFVTFAWQIPLWMLVTERVGALAAVLASLVCNFWLAAICAVKNCWWLPFAIPARLMCPMLGVLPNGLTAQVGSEMLDSAVIVPGVLITVALFILLTIVTSLWFEKCEV